ncbi:receptor expression-enhancing protein 1-like isoform X2 [Gigantopelta aegis]|uniref:receptor expression-enhancing protein 1-like isoform X2 n=1 Tax=Gigantopelta aegis TaxID=1735272 RepID=UPI001B888BB7|nr:receptor expression-enhancing protein 1-like isoform X2 [Gigantopelta aegis]
MLLAIISRLVILVFGTLYPAYASYKAVRTKNVREYVKWMIYWIVFALFYCVETFADVFISWLPFYYEVKIVFVLWLLSPMTRGSNFLFKKFVHPQLCKREKDIDEMIAQASKQSYSTLLSLGTKGIHFATNAMMRTALKGHGKLVSHLQRSFSTNDITDDGQGIADRYDPLEDEEEDQLDNRLREDNEELLRRDNRSVDISNKHSKMKKSASANAGLSIVKEVAEDEDEEVVYTEEVVYVPARKSYSHREQKQINAYGTLPRSSNRKRTSVKKLVQ